MTPQLSRVQFYNDDPSPLEIAVGEYSYIILWSGKRHLNTEAAVAIECEPHYCKISICLCIHLFLEIMACCYIHLHCILSRVNTEAAAVTHLKRIVDLCTKL